MKGKVRSRVTSNRNPPNTDNLMKKGYCMSSISIFIECMYVYQSGIDDIIFTRNESNMKKKLLLKVKACVSFVSTTANHTMCSFCIL